jgi:hypothetical protein
MLKLTIEYTRSHSGFDSLTYRVSCGGEGFIEEKYIFFSYYKRG